MPKSRIMSAGTVGTSKRIRVNGPEGGGDALQGLPPICNMRSYLIPHVRTRSDGENRDVVFCVNQLGGVGRKRGQFGAGNRAGIGLTGGCGEEELQPPTTLGAYPMSANSIELTWNATEGSVGIFVQYHIPITPTLTVPFFKIFLNSPGTNPGDTDTGLVTHLPATFSSAFGPGLAGNPIPYVFEAQSLGDTEGSLRSLLSTKASSSTVGPPAEFENDVAIMLWFQAVQSAGVWHTVNPVDPTDGQADWFNQPGSTGSFFNPATRYPQVAGGAAQNIFEQTGKDSSGNYVQGFGLPEGNMYVKDISNLNVGFANFPTGYQGDSVVSPRFYFKEFMQYYMNYAKYIDFKASAKQGSTGGVKQLTLILQNMGQPELDNKYLRFASFLEGFGIAEGKTPWGGSADRNEGLFDPNLLPDPYTSLWPSPKDAYGPLYNYDPFYAPSEGGGSGWPGFQGGDWDKYAMGKAGWRCPGVNWRRPNAGAPAGVADNGGGGPATNPPYQEDIVKTLKALADPADSNYDHNWTGGKDGATVSASITSLGQQGRAQLLLPWIITYLIKPMWAPSYNKKTGEYGNAAKQQPGDPDWIPNPAFMGDTEIGFTIDASVKGSRWSYYGLQGRDQIIQGPNEGGADAAPPLTYWRENFGGSVYGFGAPIPGQNQGQNPWIADSYYFRGPHGLNWAPSPLDASFSAMAYPDPVVGSNLPTPNTNINFETTMLGSDASGWKAISSTDSNDSKIPLTDGAPGSSTKMGEVGGPQTPSDKNVNPANNLYQIMHYISDINKCLLDNGVNGLCPWNDGNRVLSIGNVDTEGGTDGWQPTTPLGSYDPTNIPSHSNKMAQDSGPNPYYSLPDTYNYEARPSIRADWGQNTFAAVETSPWTTGPEPEIGKATEGTTIQNAGSKNTFWRDGETVRYPISYGEKGPRIQRNGLWYIDIQRGVAKGAFGPTGAPYDISGAQISAQDYVSALAYAFTPEGQYSGALPPVNNWWPSTGPAWTNPSTNSPNVAGAPKLKFGFTSSNTVYATGKPSENYWRNNYLWPPGVFPSIGAKEMYNLGNDDGGEFHVVGSKACEKSDQDSGGCEGSNGGISRVADVITKTSMDNAENSGYVAVRDREDIDDKGQYMWDYLFTWYIRQGSDLSGSDIPGGPFVPSAVYRRPNGYPLFSIENKNSPVTFMATFASDMDFNETNAPYPGKGGGPVGGEGDLFGCWNLKDFLGFLDVVGKNMKSTPAEMAGIAPVPDSSFADTRPVSEYPVPAAIYESAFVPVSWMNTIVDDDNFWPDKAPFPNLVGNNNPNLTVNTEPSAKLCEGAQEEKVTGCEEVLAGGYCCKAVKTPYDKQ